MPDTIDRRKVVVKLTNRGLSLYLKIYEKRNEQIEKSFKGLTEEEIMFFTETIDRVIKNIEDYEKEF